MGLFNQSVDCFVNQMIDIRAGPGIQVSTKKLKAFEKHRFRPMYAGANMGHPSTAVRKRNSPGPLQFIFGVAVRPPAHT